jgi:hypothetical protein
MHPTVNYYLQRFMGKIKAVCQKKDTGAVLKIKKDHATFLKYKSVR